MQIIPAIDLKNNKCVRLTRGKDETSVVYNNDPQKQAIYFQEIGCKKIHIVDLDAAFGRPEINISSIIKIRESVSIPIQLGGGIRTCSYAEKYFDMGIENLIIGSMSTNQTEATTLLAKKYKNRIYISLDIKDNNIMVKGWKLKSRLKIDDLLDIYADSHIKGYIITDIKNDGMLEGLNTSFVKNISEQIHKTHKKVIIAGGLTNYEDLKILKTLNLNNIEGIISGKSFYVGNIDLIKAQKILDQNA